MIRITVLAALAVCLAGPALAQDGAPAPEVQVTLRGPGFYGEITPEIEASAEASARLLAAVTDGPDQSGWFKAVAWPDYPVARHCTLGTLEEADVCVRAAFQGAPEWRFPPVARALVSYRAVEDGALDWVCTGIALDPTNREAQAVRFQPAEWSDEALFWEARKAAAACILAAAAESGW